MAVEDDILATLKRIEKALANGSVTSGLGRAPTVAGGANAGSGSGRRGGSRGPIDRDASDQKKVFRAATAALKEITNSTQTLNRGFNDLNKTIFSTRGHFVSMNRTMRSMPRTLPAPTPTPPPAPVPPARPAAPPAPPTPPRTPTPPRPRYNTDPWAALPKFLRDLGPGLTGTIGQAIRDAREAARPIGGGVGGPDARINGPADFGPRPQRGRLANAVSDLTNRLGGASKALIGFTVALSTAIVPVVQDILYLQSAGIQASSALGGLYIDAARSGMSLREYTAVLQASSVAVTRSGSMAEFNKTLQVSRDRLENLGIFGAEATKLSASLASSTTALGIPQERLTDATNAQIDTFERLRKTSLLTAGQFQALTESLATNQTVQSQLLGMAPAQRAARLNELVQTKSIGLSMGSTKAASDALGDALIATRNLTAPKRFEAAGRINQAGALFGMDPAATSRLADLSRRKIRTADEDREVVALAGPLQAAMQRAMQSGNIAQENIAEQMQAALDSSGIGDVLKKAGNVALTADSGPAGVNRDFAKGTSDLLKATGRLNAWLEGLEKNTIIKALGVGAIGGLIGELTAAVIRRVIPAAVPGAGAGGAAGGVLSRLFPTFSRIISGTVGMLTSGISRLSAFIRGGGPLSGTLSLFDRISIAFSNFATTMRGVPAFISNAAATVRGFFSGPLSIFDRISIGLSNFATTMRGIAPTVMNAISTVGGWFSNLIPTIRGAVPSISGALGGVSRIFGSVGSTVGGWLSSLGNTFGGFFNAMGSGIIGGLLRRIPVLMAIWDAVSELFTGTITAAFNPSGNATWGEMIGNAAFAIFNGFIGGVGKAVDWLFSFFSNDGLHVENALNVVGVMLKTGLLKMFAWATDWIPGFSKKTTEYFEKAAGDSNGVLDKLLSDNKATVASIGAKSKEEIDKKTEVANASKAQADKTVAAQQTINTANAGILSSTQGIATNILSTAQTIAAPAPSPVKNVTQPTVNSPETQAATQAAAANTAATTAATTTGNDAIIAQLVAMNQVLTSMLTSEQAQAVGIAAIAAASGRPVFPLNNEVKFDLLQGGRYTG